MLHDPKMAAKSIVAGMTGSAPDDAPEDDGSMGLESAAGDLISAVHAKDTAGVVSALRAAFTMLDAAGSTESPPDDGQ